VSVPAQQPLALLVNPTSGGGRARTLLPRVEKALDERRLSFRVEMTRSAEHAVEEALGAADAGELPVVMSGDGLIGVVGGALVGTSVPLGIVPGGRGNDFARVLGIPAEPEGAVEILAEGHTRLVDVGEANGKRFLGIASVGFDSDCQDIANRTKLVRGRWVYAYSALRALATWKPARFTLRVGEENLRFSGWSVAAANSSTFGGGMRLAPDASLEDGEFDVVMVGQSGRLRYISNLPKVFKGTHVENEEVRIVRTSRLELSASRPFTIYADGDPLTDLPASLRVLPRALHVVAPPAPS
jgi:YegS/Rv2252/BmrU family lipid kinase